MNEVSLKPVIDELETLFSKFNKAFFEGKKEVHVLCGECEVAFEEQE